MVLLFVLVLHSKLEDGGRWTVVVELGLTITACWRKNTHLEMCNSVYLGALVVNYE